MASKEKKEELKRYRKLGTIEELSRIVADYKRELYNLQQYRKIGTIEQFKNLKERHKQEKKKPYIDNVFSSDEKLSRNQYVFHETGMRFICTDQFYTCPTCNRWLVQKSELLGNRSNAPASCPSCGQKLDWS